MKIKMKFANKNMTLLPFHCQIFLTLLLSVWNRQSLCLNIIYCLLLGKPHHKKKRKSSDNVTRKGPPPPRQLVTAWGCGAELLPLVTA